MATSPAAVESLGDRLAMLGWVTDLWVGGSLATGDYVPGRSDVDLVAVTDRPLDASLQAILASIHGGLDGGMASGLKVGCVYVVGAQIHDLHASHPTWTHGSLVQRRLSGVARAELARHGYGVFGRAPQAVLPVMSDDDVRAATRDELADYWAWAVRRPWYWLDRGFADLGLTSMSRARHSLATGGLLSKTEAIEFAAGPGWLIDQLRARRNGGDIRSPRVRTALIAWRDARRTVALIS